MRRTLLAILLAALTACAPGAEAVAPPTASPPPPVATFTPAPRPTAAPAPSPTLLATATAVLDPTVTAAPETTLLFVGDIQLGRCVYTLAEASGDLASPFTPLSELLSAADITIGSLDGTISDFEAPSPCREDHRNLLGPSSMIVGLQQAGFDVITTATNHAKDCGLVRGCTTETLIDTRDLLQAAGIQPVGTGSTLQEALAPVVIEANGVRFAFVGLNGINEETWARDAVGGTAPLDWDVYPPAFVQAAAKADVVIALPHWGSEYRLELNWLQVTHAERVVELGADLVVGNHPHRVQAIETLPGGAVVAYALGNFVFDQQWSDGSMFTIQGIILRARFRGAELIEVEPIPIQIFDNYQPRLAPPVSASMILSEMEQSLQSHPAR
jgi:poly-gamma-glutamate synthesis protein (capsule biosynthesis protein)